MIHNLEGRTPHNSTQQQNIQTIACIHLQNMLRYLSTNIISVFRDANSFPLAKFLKLEKNGEFRGADNTSVADKNFWAYFRAKWRLDSYFWQQGGSCTEKFENITLIFSPFNYGIFSQVLNAFRTIKCERKYLMDNNWPKYDTGQRRRYKWSLDRCSEN